MFASGCAASATAWAASLTSHSDRSRAAGDRQQDRPARPRASSRAAARRRPARPRRSRACRRAHADAEQRRAGVGHDRPHVGEVEVDQAGQRDQVGDALDALAQHVVGDAERLDHRRLLVEHRQQPVVRARRSACRPRRRAPRCPCSAACARREPSKPNGLVTMPTVSAPSSRAIRATTGARARAGAAARAGGDEDHVGALEQRLDPVVVLHRGVAAALGVGAGAEPAREVGADLQRRGARRTAAATARRC